ncbi:MAG: hypothetical protein WA061_05250 [Microgenomates group bacterium]
MKNSDLRSNPTDRYVLSSQLQEYISLMNAQFPSIKTNLKELRSSLVNNLDCLC